MKEKITRFEDMTVWQDAQSFAVAIYKTTNTFPKDEIYGLTSQMRRASSSVSANIAEGFGRGTRKDQAHFYHIALGSLFETKNFIYLSAKLDFIEQKEVDKIVDSANIVHNQITAILRYFNGA
jgi:four helix bundle protein